MVLVRHVSNDKFDIVVFLSAEHRDREPPLAGLGAPKAGAGAFRAPGAGVVRLWPPPRRRGRPPGCPRPVGTQRRGAWPHWAPEPAADPAGASFIAGFPIGGSGFGGSAEPGAIWARTSKGDRRPGAIYRRRPWEAWHIHSDQQQPGQPSAFASGALVAIACAGAPVLATTACT